MLRVDKLALVWGYIFHIAAFLGVLYAIHEGERLQSAMAQIYMGSAIAAVFAGDLITLFVFWELTSLSSYLLIGYFNHESTSRSAAKKALVITSLGGFFMLLGFLLIHSITGSFDLTFLLSQPESIQSILRENGIFLPILFAIIIAGCLLYTSPSPRDRG